MAAALHLLDQLQRINFGTVAKNYSTCQSGKRGGDGGSRKSRLENAAKVSME